MSDPRNAISKAYQIIVGKRWDKIAYAHYDIRESRAALVVAASLGLGELFDDDERAEYEWMAKPRDIFNGKSAMTLLLTGTMDDVRDVLDAIEQARHLQ